MTSIESLLGPPVLPPHAAHAGADIEPRRALRVEAWLVAPAINNKIILADISRVLRF
jgi:hypothetical protein